MMEIQGLKAVLQYSLMVISVAALNRVCSAWQASVRGEKGRRISTHMGEIPGFDADTGGFLALMP